MKLSTRLTRAGMTVMVFGTCASLLPSGSIGLAMADTTTCNTITPSQLQDLQNQVNDAKNNANSAETAAIVFGVLGLGATAAEYFANQAAKTAATKTTQDPATTTPTAALPVATSKKTAKNLGKTQKNTKMVKKVQKPAQQVKKVQKPAQQAKPAQLAKI